MTHAKKVIYLFFYWFIYSGLLKYFGINSRIIDFVPDILTLYLGYLTMRKPSDVNMHSIIGKTIIRLIYFFFIIGIAAGFIDQANPLSVLWGAHFYICYLFLIIGMWKCFEPEDIIKLRKILIQGLFINLLAVVVEVFILGIRGDLLGGTFIGNAIGYSFMMPCLFIMAAEYFREAIDIKVFVISIAGVVFFALAGEVKFVYFTLPVIIYSIYIFLKRFTYRHIAVLFIGYIALIPTYQYFMQFFYGQDYIDQVFTTEYVEKETSSTGFGGAFNRTTSIEMSMLYLLQDPTSMVIGHGFGASSTSGLFVNEFANKHQYLVYQYFSPSYLLAEVGWTGFLLFIAIHILLLLAFFRWYRYYKDDEIMRYWTTIGICSTLMQFLIIWYNNIPVIFNYPMSILWGLVLVAMKYRMIEIEESVEESEVI